MFLLAFIDESKDTNDTYNKLPTIIANTTSIISSFETFLNATILLINDPIQQTIFVMTRFL